MVLSVRSARETQEAKDVGAVAIMGAFAHRRARTRTSLCLVAAFACALGTLRGPSRSWKAPPDVDTIPRGLRPEWSLENNMSPNSAWSFTRFRRDDLPGLAQALRIPDYTSAAARRSPAWRRSSARSCALPVRPRGSSCACSWATAITSVHGHMFYRVLDHIFNLFEKCIDDITRWEEWVRRGRAIARCVPRAARRATHSCAPPPRVRQLPHLAAMVALQNLPVRDLIGFIDGTARHTCRPTSDQDLAYNGYYGYHGIKFHGIMSLLGLWLEWWGPACIRAADSMMMRRSGLLHRLAALEQKVNVAYQIYGDSAYPKTRYTQASYKGPMTQAQVDFCNMMNPKRQVVENGFGHLMSLWAFLDFKPNLKLEQVPVGRMFWVAAILTNLHVIQYGDAISAKYKTNTPLTWERYLHEFPLRWTGWA